MNAFPQCLLGSAIKITIACCQSPFPTSDLLDSCEAQYLGRMQCESLVLTPNLAQGVQQERQRCSKEILKIMTYVTSTSTRCLSALPLHPHDFPLFTTINIENLASNMTAPRFTSQVDNTLSNRTCWYGFPKSRPGNHQHMDLNHTYAPT